MINENYPLSMAEVMEYLGDDEVETVQFIKKFSSLAPEQAKELRKKIEEMENMKIKPEHISKIIDLVPENQEDLNKIFVGVSLDEDESKKIFDTIKEYK